jgi:hypothetical protein
VAQIIGSPKEPNLDILAANLGHQPDFVLKSSHLSQSTLRCIEIFCLLKIERESCWNKQVGMKFPEVVELNKLSEMFKLMDRGRDTVCIL